jgi:hypothetical protein
MTPVSRKVNGLHTTFSTPAHCNAHVPFGSQAARIAVLALCVLIAAPGGLTAAAATVTAGPNPILAENQQPGTSGWLTAGPFADDATGQIKGYWSATSVKQNENLNLFVSVNQAQTFTIDIYRLGWYQGFGGRLRLHAGPLDAVTQNACVPDPNTGLIACNWTPSYTLTVPGDWVSGVYFGLLKNAAGFQNYTVFVVRDDRPAALLYQQNIATDQAYNNYPNDGRTGKSIYTYNSFGANTMSGDARAVKVSFDRPYADRGVAQVDQIEFIRWIERSGYDVTYATDLDTHANGSSLRNHKGVLVVGHDEYWSKQIFDALEGARDAGVGLAFFAADTGSVQVRFEPSASGKTDRVMICYKVAALDPVSGPTTTVAFRQPPVNRPEQSLRGVISFAMLQGQANFDYVVTNSSHWIYAGTGFKDGDVVPGIVGYEMDGYKSAFPAPNSTDWTLLSSSPFVDYLGAQGVSNSSVYQAPSGAWVFSSGTISWSWALDGFWHQRADLRIQRTTANLLDAFINGAPVAARVDHVTVTAPPTATAGAPFNVTVAAVDANGAPVASYSGTVHFSSSDGAAAVVLPADATLTNGQRTFSLTLATAGAQTVTVSDTANSLSATATVTVNAGAAHHLALATAETPRAGDSFSLSVTALDALGNIATAYAGRVRFTSSDSAATLPPDSTLTNGQGTFAVTLTTGGSQTISGADTATASIVGSLTVDVVPAAPTATALRITGPSTATAGEPFSVTVAAVDANGAPVASYSGTVHFSSNDGASAVVLPADATLTNGQRTFSVTLVTAGSRTLTATDTETSTVTGSAAIDVVAGPAARLALSTTATPTAGTSFSFTVKALDQFGNSATAYAGRVHFTSSDGAATLPPDSTLTNGQATFAATLTRAGSQTITATDTATATIGGALTVTVRAATAVRLILAGSPTARAGSPFQFSVTAQDQFGNTDLAYAGNVHFTSSDTSAGAVLPSDATLNGGQGTFSATLAKAGAQTITGTDVARPTVKGSLSVTVTPGTATTLVLDSPSSTTAGAAFTVKVTLRDQYGNVATGYTGAIHFSTSDPLPTVVLPEDYTFTAGDAGSHSFSVRLWTVGNQTLTAADKVAPSLSDTNTISVRLLLL